MNENNTIELLPFQVLRLGLMDYRQAWDLQKQLVEKRSKKEIVDTLILVEHPHVFTIGRRGSKDNILVPERLLKEKNVSVYEVDRGGDITYHGPGQIVGYPILDLNGHGRDIHLFLRNLEEVIIRFLAEYEIEAFRKPGYTGVWVEACGERSRTKGKIAAIGVGVRHWITLHGFCLNINPDMEYFSMINPCGLTANSVTSLQALKPEVCLTDKENLEKVLLKHFEAVFNLERDAACLEAVDGK